MIPSTSSSKGDRSPSEAGLYNRRTLNDKDAIYDEKRIDYGSAAAYADAVRKWLHDNHCWNVMHQQQVANLHSMIQASAAVANTVLRPHGNTTHTGTGHGNTVIQAANGRRLITAQYRAAPLMKRVLAELNDFLMLFIVKLCIIFVLIDLEIMDVSGYEKLLSNRADFQSFIDISQDLFSLELLGKVVVSVYEAFCITYGFFGRHPGSTPGKFMMGLRVISAHTVNYDANVPGQITVTGYERVPFPASLLRSLFKNLFINSLLPLSSIAFGFHYNRAIYDLASKTVVVEI